MTRQETMGFLTHVGHGVLSLARDDRGYGIPVSYGYDDVDNQFLFEFLSIPPSRKQAFLAASHEVTLTVYDVESPEEWVSAIVTGSIHHIPVTELSERAIATTNQSVDAAQAVRWTGVDGLERDWYALVPTNITGRRRHAAPC